MAILKAKNREITFNNKVSKGNPFDFLQNQLQDFHISPSPSLPPFQGGVMGYFGYELYQHLENIPLIDIDDQNVPDMLLGFYDLVISFDCETKKAWIFSFGFPFKTQTYAQDRLNWVLDQLKQPFPVCSALFESSINITSNLDYQSYTKVVQKTIDYIYAGDIFQANIARRFEAFLPLDFSVFNLYCKLRKVNLSPFNGYAQFDEITVLSASPERFLKLTQDFVETCPIKGTQRRDIKNNQKDQIFALELENSKKNHAENIMIVDLLRNDLSRVCLPHTVKVKDLLTVETFPTIHHLVSTITGQLRPGLDAIDLLKATFPGGSITGVPKIRSMEIISELEPHRRGPYCGTMGYIGFDGCMDMNIIIRTFIINKNHLTFHTGGGITADSIPHDEYEETEVKAFALKKVLGHDSSYR